MNVIGWRFHKGCVMLIICECYWMCNVDNMWMLLDEGSIRVCNVDNMWMLLDEDSIRVSDVDNMWMLLDEGSIIKGV